MKHEKQSGSARVLVCLSAAAAAAVVAATSPAWAASATWNASPTDANWVVTTENNWSTGATTYPGGLGTTTNADVATFNTASSQLSISLNATNLNVKSLTFDTAAGNYVIGTLASGGGSSLFLTSGGAISIANTISGANKTETINAPLVLEGAYSLTNNTGTSTVILDIASDISGVSGSQTLTLNGANGAANVVSGAISNGSATSLAIAKSGSGTWHLSGTNTYTGGTTITAGLLQFDNSNAVPTSGSITVSAGGALAAAGANTTVTGWLTSGKIATSSTGTIAITGSSSENIDFATPGYNSLALGATTTATYSGTITPGTNGYRLGGATGALTISSPLTGANNVTAGIGGVSEFIDLTNSSNSFSGALSVPYGSLQIASAAALGNPSSISVSSGAELQIPGGQTIGAGKGITISGSGTDSEGALKEAGSTTATWAGNVTLGADQSRFGANSSGGVLIVSGVVDSGANTYGPAIRLPNSYGTGYVEFSNANTYKGNTSIVVGVLKQGAVGALPATTVVQLGNNSGQGTSVLDLNGFNATITAVTMTSGANEAGTITNSSSTAATLNVTGTSTFGSVVSNTTYGTMSGNLGLTKSNSGSLTLLGAVTNSPSTGMTNYTYTGATTITGGTLALGQANVLPDASPMVLGGGTFATGGFSETTGTLSVNSNSTIDMGNGASVLAFANSSAQSWTGTLSILNWSGSTSGGGTDQLFVGSNSTGLTAAQLADIQFSGYPAGAQILSNGEVVPTPEPASVIVAGAAALGLLLRRRRRVI